MFSTNFVSFLLTLTIKKKGGRVNETNLFCRSHIKKKEKQTDIKILESYATK